MAWGYILHAHRLWNKIEALLNLDSIVFSSFYLSLSTSSVSTSMSSALLSPESLPSPSLITCHARRRVP